jgi:hypothetical protein
MSSSLTSSQGTQGLGTIIQAIDPSLDLSVSEISQPTEENLSQS